MTKLMTVSEIVETQYPRLTRRMPWIRMRGKWLEKAGFPAGSTYKVTVMETGKMMLESQSSAACADRILNPK